MSAPVIEVKDLVCGYDAFRLQELAFQVDKGGFVGIIGPNGSGKTSLLRALTRILKPIKGSILLQGKNLRHIDYQELARLVAVVSQQPGVSHISVEDFVLLGRIPHHRRFQFLDSEKDLDMAVRAMEATDTLRFKEKALGELSGGERQLVLIARALAQEPEILLLDEPTAFLDISHQVKIMDLLRRLNGQTGLTVMVVLHDLNLAAEYCASLLLMNGGRIHRSGSPDEVLTYPIIEEVYQTPVVVGQSPVSKRPYIFLVTGRQLT